ncbi:MAG: hypothetical protein HYU27_04730 [Acidobacteria bacterium]|nr:hypothetical protein [Acidobacteriota bacterium]
MDLLAPIARHLCLPRVAGPSCDGGTDFLDDGFRPPAFHQSTFGAPAKVSPRKSVALAVALSELLREYVKDAGFLSCIAASYILGY